MARLYNDTADAGADYAFDLYAFTTEPTAAQLAALRAAATVDAALLAAEELTPLDFTGCTAELLLGRNLPAGRYQVKLTSSPPAGITLDTALGRISVRLTAAQTAALRWGPVSYFLRLTWPSGSKERILEGTLRINPEPVRE